MNEHHIPEGMNMKRDSIKTVLVVLLSLSVMSCQSKQHNSSEPRRIQETPPALEITSEAEEEGIQDFVFNLWGIDQLPGGGQRLIAKGTHLGTGVEVEVNLQPEWKDGVGIVEIRSLGAGSDSLLRTMDLLYDTQLRPKRMAETTKFAALPLEGNPTHLQSGPVKLKLFFESEDEDEDGYAELYLDVEAGRSRLYLKEKDPDYRKAIIMAMTSKAK